MSRCFIVFLLAFYLGLGSAQLNLTCFQNDGGVLVSPQDANYNNDRLIFNEKIQNEPAAIAYAYSEEQVQQIVHCAKVSGLKAVPRGGGHGYEGIHRAVATPQSTCLAQPMYTGI